MNTVVTADVRENINSIDSIMKGKAEVFKDISRQLPRSISTVTGVQNSMSH